MRTVGGSFGGSKGGSVRSAASEVEEAFSDRGVGDDDGDNADDAQGTNIARSEGVEGGKSDVTTALSGIGSAAARANVSTDTLSNCEDGAFDENVDDNVTAPSDFPLCRNIDEAMHALHTLLSEAGRSPYDAARDGGGDGGSADEIEQEYDWILDGSIYSGGSVASLASSRHVSTTAAFGKSPLCGTGDDHSPGRSHASPRFGQDPRLDASLAGLELETGLSYDTAEEGLPDDRRAAASRPIGGLLMMAGAMDAMIHGGSFDLEGDDHSGRNGGGGNGRQRHLVFSRTESAGTGEAEAATGRVPELEFAASGDDVIAGPRDAFRFADFDDAGVQEELHAARAESAGEGGDDTIGGASGEFGEFVSVGAADDVEGSRNGASPAEDNGAADDFEEDESFGAFISAPGTGVAAAPVTTEPNKEESVDAAEEHEIVESNPLVAAVDTTIDAECALETGADVFSTPKSEESVVIDVAHRADEVERRSPDTDVVSANSGGAVDSTEPAAIGAERAREADVGGTAKHWPRADDAEQRFVRPAAEEAKSPAESHDDYGNRPPATTVNAAPGGGETVSSDVSSSASESESETGSEFETDSEDGTYSDSDANQREEVNMAREEEERRPTRQDRLLLALPVPDVSRPEGRFARRLRAGLLAESASSEDPSPSPAAHNAEPVADLDSGDNDGDDNSEDSDDGLPPDFHSEGDGGDLVMDVLRSMPWYNPRDPSRDFLRGRLSGPGPNPEGPPCVEHLSRIDEHLTENLSELDELQSNVTKRLVRRACAKEGAIFEGLRSAQSIDLELARCHVHASEGAKFLRRARMTADVADGECGGEGDDGSELTGGWGAGVLGGLDVVRCADRRDCLLSLSSVLDDVSELVRAEADLTSRISGPSTLSPAHFGDIIAGAVELRSRIEGSADLRNVACLAPLRERVRAMPDRLRERARGALARMLARRCGRLSEPSSSGEVGGDGFAGAPFDDGAYGMLLAARIDLQKHLDRFEGCDTCPAEEADSTAKAAVDVAIFREWSDCTLETLRFEARKALARALLDPATSYEDDGDDTQTDGLNVDDDDVALARDIDENLLRMRLQLNSVSRANDGDDDTASSSALESALHNLCTVRFDFERRLSSSRKRGGREARNRLPGVYRRLCAFLAEILHVHSTLLRWHEKRRGGAEDGSAGSSDDDAAALRAWNGGIAAEVRDSRVRLWQTCKGVLIDVLERYLEHVTKSKSGGGASCAGDDDLEGLHEVLRLSDCVVLLGQEFLGPRGDNGDAEGGSRPKRRGLCQNGGRGRFCEALANVFRRHLRGVHVEAMNVTGALLANETWSLAPVEIRASGGSSSHFVDKIEGLRSGEEIRRSLGLLFEDLCPQLLRGSASSARASTNGGRNVDDLLRQRFRGEGGGSCDVLTRFASLGNPFQAVLGCEATHGDCSARSTTSTIASSEDVDVNVEARRQPHSGGESGKDVANDSGVDTHYASNDPSIGEERASAPIDTELYSVLFPFVDYDPDGRRFLPLGTQSAVNGLARWTARLLAVLTELPLIARDVVRVVTNLYDLYLATSFRLCCGDGASERVVLGLQERCAASGGDDNDAGGSEPPRTERADEVGKRASGRSSYIFRSKPHTRRQQAAKPRPAPRPRAVSPTVEADICAPLQHGDAGADAAGGVRDFVIRGQEELAEMVNFDKIEEWGAMGSDARSLGRHGHSAASNRGGKKEEEQAAGEASALSLRRRGGVSYSCLFVAALLDSALAYAEQTAGEDDLLVESGMESLRDYVRSVVEIAPAFVSISSRMACAHAVGARNIVQEIACIGPGWDEPKLNERANDYIDRICSHCSWLWWHISSPSGPELPSRVVKSLWGDVVQVYFLAILEGFSMVRACSTEGRALMSMDLAALASGLDPHAVLDRLPGTFRSDHFPPSITPERGMLYVDMYVKAFYFPEEDVTNWISENHREYHLSHLLALVAVVYRRVQDGNKVAEMRRKVKALKHTNVNRKCLV